MAYQKNKKAATLWFQCSKCSTTVVNKDTEKHSNDCPPDITNLCYGFVKESTLYGIIEVKANEDIKNILSKDCLVFLSQSTIQLCSLAIGEWAIVKLVGQDVPAVARMVWPTNEKTLTSVLFTRNSLHLASWETGQYVSLSCLPKTVKTANIITLIILNAPKSLEINSELANRIQKTHIGKYFTKGNIVTIMYYGKVLMFEIKDIKSRIEDITQAMSDLEISKDEFFLSDNSTKWKLYKDDKEYKKEVEKSRLFKIAGLDDEYNEISEMMTACLTKSIKTSIFLKSRSVLLYGHSGTGKTLLANVLATNSNANVISLSAPDLYTKFAGNPEETIKELFQRAIDNGPSVIILDEIDILCPVRSSRITDIEKRIVSTLLILLDSLNETETSNVFIIATTNKPDNIDPAFRRCGRLDREIEVPTPSPKSRESILNKLLDDVEKNLTAEETHEIARITHGFVGADLVSLCSRASLNAVRKGSGIISYEDFMVALKIVRPSAMREVQIESPNVKWSDIGGQENLKLILRQAVEWPLKYAENFVRLGVTPPRGVLMYGPPGCSKTMIAKALATESGLNFLSIKGPELFSKWVGESERAVREVFRKARQVAPSIIFFDEIDALGSERSASSATSVQERVLAQLLTELDGVTPLGNVTVLAATNRPDRIDKALLRPGRLDRIVYVPLPDEHTRMEIFKIKLGKMPALNVDIEKLVNLTDGYSGAEVNAVCHEAAIMALEESLEIQHVEDRHFKKALSLVTPRTSPSLLQIYDNYKQLKI